MPLVYVLAGAGLLALVVIAGFARGFPIASAIVWRPAIARFERLDRTERQPADAVLCYGSSTIRLWDTIHEDLAPFPVIQRGFGGARMCDVLRYVGRVFKRHRPRAILIYVANDITGSLWDISPSHSAELFSRTLTRLRRRFPTTPVFYVTTNPTPRRVAAWPEIAEASRLIAAVCDRDPNAHVINATASVCDASGNAREDLFGPDRLHMNREGYRLWSEPIRARLSDVLGTAGSWTRHQPANSPQPVGDAREPT